MMISTQRITSLGWLNLSPIDETNKALSIGKYVLILNLVESLQRVTNKKQDEDEINR